MPNSTRRQLLPSRPGLRLNEVIPIANRTISANDFNSAAIGKVDQRILKHRRRLYRRMILKTSTSI